MGGVSSTVQQSQTSGAGGKGGPMGQSAPQAQNYIYGQPTDSQLPSPTQPTGGKGASGVNSYPGPQGMQGASTNSATSGQPMIGAPNQYSNTVGQWDNTQIKPTAQGGKGKGA